MAANRDYSLIGTESSTSVASGLAEASWHISPVSREDMMELLIRRNGPAIRDTLLWFFLIIGSGYLFFILWGSWWAIIPYFMYATLYAATSDSRWHESSHGTAFKSDWMNNVLYEIASFMVFRQSIPWKWSHTRHHSDTIIRGRDPEIAYPRPTDIMGSILQIFALKSAPVEFKKMMRHALGNIDPEVATYLPKSEYHRVFLRARIYLLIYAASIGLSIYYWTILPLMFIGIPTFVGTWLMLIYGTTQHAGLAENVLDHRLNCRTVYMNVVNRYLYWNMNYHLEHHMFPLVPYYNLPKLHELIKDDCPKPYPSIFAAFQEIIPALIRQAKEPDYFVHRELPAPTITDTQHTISFVGEQANLQSDGFIEVCPVNALPKSEILRFDFNHKTFAVYHNEKGEFYATDGICTHGSTHLAEGLVIGDQIECPKHNGRFDITNGSVQKPPVCVSLLTYEVKIENDKIYLNIKPKNGQSEEQKTKTFKVISNDNVATFIKELVLEPIESEEFSFTPGDYVQLDIPAFDASFEYIDVSEPYNKVWKDENIFRLHVSNDTNTRRNYSMANNPQGEDYIRFNVRLATPPLGMDCSAGVGSSYVFGLKKGDIVTAIGPFGDFHVKDTENEMLFIGGGAGMAPLKSQISYLFETLKTKRKVSFWYGGRSRQELFYVDYFEKLALEYNNFTFHTALSEPKPEDNWTALTGFIHQIVENNYLKTHVAPNQIEYYLCGPPAMISATQVMLKNFNVDGKMIAFDEF